MHSKRLPGCPGSKQSRGLLLAGRPWGDQRSSLPDERGRNVSHTLLLQKVVPENEGGMIMRGKLS